MKVRIEENIFLESDDYQYILKEYLGTYMTVNKGKDNEYSRENYKVVGYFRTLEQVINKLFKMEIKKSTASNLEELRKDVLRAREYIDGLFRDKELV